MSKNDIFFLNTFPPNDRQENIEFDSVLSSVSKEVSVLELKHTLFTSGAKRIDPWVLAQRAIERDPKLSPLVAVNPIYQTPVSVAKTINSLSQIYPNPLSVNLISGSFFREQNALKDSSSFEDKTKRLLDFYNCLRKLIVERKPVFHDGEYYQLAGLELLPHFSGHPVRYFMSGQFNEELKDCDDTYFVRSLRPVDETRPSVFKNNGLLLGVCARESREEAIAAVDKLYPEDKKGQRIYEFSLANELTPWAKWIEEYSSRGITDYHYYLRPMKNFWSPAPFLVGSYSEVADLLRSYVSLSYTFFILDFKHDDLVHVQRVLDVFKGK